MHVPLRGHEILMPGELLNRSCGCTAHRQPGAERVPKPVNAARRELRSPSASTHGVGDHVVCQRRAVALTHHTLPSKVAVVAECGRQSARHRDVPRSAALWRGDVTSPFRALDGELTRSEIDISPFQSNHLSAP